MKRQDMLMLGVAALAAVGAAGPVYAQETRSGASSEEIVVTARKREESLQDVPISITAIGEQALANRNVNELIDLQRQVPGMQISSGTAGPQIAIVTIRGQGQADQLLTTDSSVGVYIDGVNNPRSLGLSSILQDVQRVEVLRGPQGTLFGRNTTGGAISVITNAPGDEFGGSLRAIVGDYNNVDVSGVLNVPLGEDAGLRLFARRSTRDGFAQDSAGRDLNDEDLTFVRARMDVNPAPYLDISLTADYARNQTGGAAIQLYGYQPALAGGTVAGGYAAVLCGCDPTVPANFAAWSAQIPVAQAYLDDQIVNGGLDRTNGGSEQLSNAESWGASADISLELSPNLTLRSISGYRELQKRDVEDLDATPLDILTPDLRARYNFFSQELQLLGGSDTFNWVLGAFYSNEEGNDGSVTPAFADLGNTVNPNIYDADINNSSVAVFGQATWEFAPRWSFTGGLRWTEETKEMVSRNHLILVPQQEQPPITAPFMALCRIDPTQLDDPDICEASFSDTFSDTSWLLSLDYDLTDDVMVYASVAQGFRGGGQNLRGTPLAGTFEPFEPETALNYELGVKSTTFDGRLVLNGAVFFTDYQDIQRSIIVAGVPPEPPATVVSNAASATLTGAEVEVAWRPIDPLTLSLTAAYLNGEYDEYQDGPLDRSNDPWPAPEWTYSASARYVVPMSTGDLAFQLDYSHADAFSAAIAGVAPSLVPFLQGNDTDLLNGRISLDIDSINGQVAIFARNLADEDYYTARLNVVGLVTRYAGYPRFVGAEFRVRFGGEAD